VSHNIIVNGPTALFKFDTVCVGDSTHFTDQSTIVLNGAILTNWTWNFGDGATSSLENPAHKFPAGNNYNVQLTIKDAKNCQSVINHNIIVNHPTAKFNFDTACFNTVTHFTDQSFKVVNGANISKWKYWFDNIPTGLAYSKDTVYKYPTPGNKVASLKVTDTWGCTDSTSRNIIVNQPYARFSYNIPCLGSQTNFIDTSRIAAVGGAAITQWRWRLGDSPETWAITQNKSFTYPLPGNYTVWHRVTDAKGCTDSISHNIVVNKPIAKFTFDTVCVGDSTSFRDLSTISAVGPGSARINQWNWNFGDPNTAGIDQNPKYLYAKPYLLAHGGNYNVRLIVTDTMGCKDTVTHAIIVNHPIPLFTFDTVCYMSTTHFTDQSSISAVGGSNIANWLWKYGNPANNTLSINAPASPNTSFNYSPAGNYSVKLVVTDAMGCHDSLTRNIIINRPKPEFNFDTVCWNSPTHFTNLSTIIAVGGSGLKTYSWIFKDSIAGVPSTSTLKNPLSYTYSHGGNFNNVTLIVTDSMNCMDSVKHNIIVDKPVPLFSADTACFNSVTTFTEYSHPIAVGGSPIKSWYWTFGDNNWATVKDAIHFYPSVGNFSAKLEVTDNRGCIDSVRHNVNVRPLPIVEFLYDTVCIGNPTHFNDATSIPAGGAGLATYTWEFGDGSSAFTKNATYTYSSAGLYSVKFTVFDSAGCSQTKTHLIKVNMIPFVDFSYDDVCLGDSTHFTPIAVSSSPIALYKWHF
jgi:PKD repeat protein